jgi:hypothetical protein
MEPRFPIKIFLLCVLLFFFAACGREEKRETSQPPPGLYSDYSDEKLYRAWKPIIRKGITSALHREELADCLTPGYFACNNTLFPPLKQVSGFVQKPSEKVILSRTMADDVEKIRHFEAQISKLPSEVLRMFQHVQFVILGSFSKLGANAFKNPIYSPYVSGSFIGGKILYLADNSFCRLKKDCREKNLEARRKAIEKSDWNGVIHAGWMESLAAAELQSSGETDLRFLETVVHELAHAVEFGYANFNYLETLWNNRGELTEYPTLRGQILSVFFAIIVGFDWDCRVFGCATLQANQRSITEYASDFEKSNAVSVYSLANRDEEFAELVSAVLMKKHFNYSASQLFAEKDPSAPLGYRNVVEFKERICRPDILKNAIGAASFYGDFKKQDLMMSCEN